MKSTAGLMEAGTLKCINSIVCHSFIITPQAAASFHAALVSVLHHPRDQSYGAH